MAKKSRLVPVLAAYSKALLLHEPHEIAEEEATHDTIVSLIAARYDSEPTSYKEAMETVNAPHWRDAAVSEFDSLAVNKTWTLVPRPLHRKVLQCRWVFARKRDSRGQVVRYKARLVIKGFQQKQGLDYTEIFSPVVRMEVLRLLLAIAAILDYEVEQMDVKTAFLHGQLSEEIYMEQPEGVSCERQRRLCVQAEEKSLWPETSTKTMVHEV